MVFIAQWYGMEKCARNNKLGHRNFKNQNKCGGLAIHVRVLELSYTSATHVCFFFSSSPHTALYSR